MKLRRAEILLKSIKFLILSLDLSFLPKDLFNNDKSYYDFKNNNAIAAIEILEKAQYNMTLYQKPEKNSGKSFWSFLNPFKCGNNV